MYWTGLSQSYQPGAKRVKMDEAGIIGHTQSQWGQMTKIKIIIFLNSKLFRELLYKMISIPFHNYR
jgi:hypothetical protein